MELGWTAAAPPCSAGVPRPRSAPPGVVSPQQRATKCAATGRRATPPAAAAAATQASPAASTQPDAQLPGEPGAAVAPPPAAAAATQPPVEFFEARTLPLQASLAAAVQQLRAAVLDVPSQAAAFGSGLVRLEVPLPRGTSALRWLRGQPGASEDPASLLHPRIYFSPRRTTAADTEGSAAAAAAAAGAGAVAGAGAAWLWRGAPGEPLGEAVMADMQRFLAGAAASPRVRAFGGARFNQAQAPAPEWREFGSYCFMIPRLEFLEASGCCILACTLAWDARHAAGGSAAAVGFASVGAAALDAAATLDAVQPAAAAAASSFQLRRLGSTHLPDEEGWRGLMEGTHARLAVAGALASTPAAADEQASPAAPPMDACTPMLKISPEAAREEYLLNGQEGLDDLLAALDGGFEAATAPQDGGLTKVVLARRTDVSLEGQVDPLALLEALQERDPRAYQLLLQMPSGACFLGSTPECLYTRTGAAVASEAVAGTRARGAGGDVERDFWLAFDLLRSHKDHVEFSVVRDWVAAALAGVAADVRVDVAKSVLKQGAVQHLYGKLSAQLKPGAGDAQLLAALHPTPAVCGRPREDALALLADSEPFDRGFYAAPFGWVSHGAAEFAVAIRSALVRPGGDEGSAAAAETRLQERRASHAAAGPGPGARGGSLSDYTHVSLFAGVGIVRGSDTAQEWAELDLKVRQYERLLQGVPPLAACPNVNALWARLLVEELCRLGCNTFCVAPGSRSSPLTVAVAQHPRARVVPCIDERSLGFWALGHSRATGRPAAVITSSGTAVANLLPAAVEASQSGVPLLLLTGDRPAELRDSGANQTIDQVKLFGSYARWQADLPPPDDALPARLVLSAADTAVQRATGPSPGPVHLNCQFREPLAPVEDAAWDRSCLQGLQRWEQGDAPFTSVASLAPPPAAVQPFGPGGVGAGSSSGSSSGAQAAALAADPAALAALRAVAGARRGLIVAAELSHPEDVVAAAQLAALLGWPVAADVLSGLRAGVHGGSDASSDSSGHPISCPAVVHHFDHLLLLDRASWRHLRPDVVLQLGGHLTSKRVSQFLDWCCSVSLEGADGGGDGQQTDSPPSMWVLAERSPKRHDQSHLLSHRLAAPLPALAAALGALREPDAARDVAQAAYTRLLRLLDDEAGAAVDAALQRFPELTEPQVARTLARQLPPGEALFVGNSMPIRDLDMYSSPSLLPNPDASGSAQPPPPLQQGVVSAAGLGAPVAANRGASGIDGVLSTAAGFADGLGRGTTLLLGDLSFLHDTNGLALLRTGEARPPLTVVLVNNSGGGIFSFLPIAGALPEEVFTPLWATPQHVDLEGICRAHGIPHQRVTAAEGLPGALRSAWALNRHSVVEVVTSRTTNLDRHREIQAAAAAAAGTALRLLQPAAALAAPPLQAPPFSLAVHSASWHAYRLPLARQLTTAPGQQLGTQHRRGLLLRVSLCGPDGCLAHGVGEVAPLPGLHSESLHQAEQQVELLCQLLSGTPAAPGGTGGTGSAGVSVPLTVALLGGRLGSWLRRGLGVEPSCLLPSVRCGLEAALLSALAQHRGASLAQLLAGFPPPAAPVQAASVNGLLDCQGSPEEAAAEAAALLASHPFSALKIKVARRADPLEDAAAVLAVRAAVGPSVALRADANRRWGLEAAAAFAAAAAPAALQYVEEPLERTADLPELYRRTGMPLALDESVDEGLVGPGAADPEALCEGLRAVVLKPAVLGGFERAAELAAWARGRGIHAVVSSSFESGLGIAQLAQLAAALDAAHEGQQGSGTPHGLATLGWLAEDVLPQGPPPLLQPLGGDGGGGVGIPVAAAHEAVQRGTTLALALDEQQQQQRGRPDGAANGSSPARALDSRQRSGARRRRCAVATAAAVYDFSLLEVLPGEGAAGRAQLPPVLLLHGFLGAAADWQPLLHALGRRRRVLALDLPGHGGTAVQPSGSGSSNSRGSGSDGGRDGSSALPAFGLEAMAEAVAAAVEREGLAGCLLAGYSLGGRLALLLAARWPHLFAGVACVSGTPGLSEPAARAQRAARDGALADALRQGGLQAFLPGWYAQPMWGPLRRSPRFEAMLRQRQGGDERQLAAVLAAASPGRAPSLWRELPAAAAAGVLPPLLLVAGTEDPKFAGMAQRLALLLAPADGQGPVADVALLPGCGHAVLVERPLDLLAALDRFFQQVAAEAPAAGISVAAKQSAE